MPMGLYLRTIHEYLSFKKSILEKSEVSVVYNSYQQYYEFDHSGRLEITCEWVDEN